ncbi:MAG: 1-deoxy-D-xylulose-5-phosphate synthase [bacterium]
MGKLLESINSPEDVRCLSMTQLVQLAEEIRKYIIDIVSQTGGHLAPNLGVVELTLALHTVFNSPHDKIIWDVGHQSYIHKLVTGRREMLPTIRTAGGLSGFPKPEESPHDIFATGHTSTSISAALGLALARDMQGEAYHVCAVIGDGALTAGMAFEALNNAGDLGTNLLVVLNDNEMSIAPNVGAMASYLSRLRSDPAYFRIKEDVEYILRKIPAIGGRVVKTVERLKDSLKYLLVAGMLFEELGFTYLGPIDGHNLPLLKRVLLSAKKIKGPVLLHVLTTKGKGYKPAEDNPDRFHGIGQFDVQTGRAVKNPNAPPSYTEVFGNTLVKLAATDNKIIGITAAMSGGTGMDKLAARFPERCFDVGIAEQHAVTLAAGLATGGLKPVVAIYSTFLQRAYDQIVHDVCMPHLPVVFALDRGGVVGEDGPTHHGVFDLAYLRHIPGMAVMAPANEAELQQMLVTALNHSGPIALRYPRGKGEGVNLLDNPDPITVGKAEILRRGKDATILALGPMVARACAAAEQLSKEGIDVTVVNARFVKPLDEELIIQEAQLTGKLITVEDHVCQGGFGSAVLELLARKNMLNCQVKLLGYGDHFVEHGNRELLLEKNGLTAAGIGQAVREMLGWDCAQNKNDSVNNHA